MTTQTSASYHETRFAFVDALSSIVGLAIGVIELTAISICTPLGPSGLEFAVIVGGTASVMFEGLGASLAQRFDCARVLVWGVWLKVIAHGLLLSAIALAVFGRTEAAWLLVGAEAIVGAIATGSIIASYRPAYGQWFKLRTGRSLDMLGTFGRFKYTRSVGPLVLWLVVYAGTQVFGKSSDSILPLTTALLSLAMALRLVQITIYRGDVGGLWKTSHSSSLVGPEASNHVQLRLVRSVLDRSRALLANHLPYVMFYVWGNLLFLLAVSYLIGQLPRSLSTTSSNATNTAMFGMLLGLLVHTGSTLLGAVLYPKASSARSRTLLFTLLAVLIVMFFGYFFVRAAEATIAVLTLSVVGVLLHLIGLGIVRAVSSSFMASCEDQQLHSLFFSLAEIISSLLLSALMFILVSYDDRNTSLAVVAILLTALPPLMIWGVCLRSHFPMLRLIVARP